MLHIILTILKIIGIVLALVLGFILLMLLIVLFVPIRYHGFGSKTEEQIKGEFTVSWLLKAICVKLKLLDKDFQYEIRIFGITLEEIQSFLGKLKKKKKVPDVKIEDPKPQAQIPEEEKTEEPKPEEPKPEEHKQEEPKPDDPKPAKVIEENNKTKKKKSQKETSKTELPKSEIPETSKKSILQLPGKLLDAIKKIQLTIKGICDKIKYWLDFLNEEHTRGSITLIRIQLMKVLKHILPRKLKGNLLFGFEDPSKTGQILAGICMFYPFYYKQLNISPDFTQAILLGDIEIKGRIYLAYFVKTAIRVFFDRNIQYVWKKLKK